MLGVRGGGEARGDAAGEAPAERGVRAKTGDCDALEAAGEPRRAGVKGALERGLRGGGLAPGCDMALGGP